MIQDKAVVEGPGSPESTSPRLAYSTTLLNVPAERLPGADTEEASIDVGTYIDETRSSDETQDGSAVSVWVTQLLTTMEKTSAKTDVPGRTPDQDKAFLLQLYRENYSAAMALALLRIRFSVE